MKENKEYQEKKEQEKVVHEPTGSYGMDTITMRQKIMERVMLMEENQLKEMLALVDEAEKVLVDKQSDLDEFGRLLDHTWRIKRKTGNTVSTNSIDELYYRFICFWTIMNYSCSTIFKFKWYIQQIFHCFFHFFLFIWLYIKH